MLQPTPRILLHILAAAGLVAATVTAWNHGHEIAEPGRTVVLREAGPWLEAGPAAWRLDLGEFGEADGLHLRFTIEAEGVERGPEPWQDGRLHLEWIRDGERLDRIYLFSIRGTRSASEPSAIHRGAPPGATAELHLENLGESGRLRLVRFEAFPTRASPSGRLGLTLAGIGWLVWLASVAGPPRRLRSWLAGLTWLVPAWFLVIPGPWPKQSPLIGSFALDDPAKPSSVLEPADFTVATSQPGAVESPNLLLRWKIKLRPLRPLLNGVLFFVPTLGLLAFASSERRAIGLAALLAASVEAAQWAFGYGFAMEDVADLATDAGGIALAWLAFRSWCRYSPIAASKRAVAPAS